MFRGRGYSSRAAAREDSTLGAQIWLGGLESTKSARSLTRNASSPKHAVIDFGLALFLQSGKSCRVIPCRVAAL
jgi:hypothetical protein